MNTDATISAVHRGVTNTLSLVPAVRNDVVDTRATVSDSHCKASKISEDVCGQDRKVGIIRSPPGRH